MNKKENNSICILGLRGFPDGCTAKVSRYSSIVRILLESGYQVLVVNKDFTKSVQIKENGNGGSIKTIGSISFSSKSYTVSKLLKKTMAFWEFFAILRHNGFKKINIIIVYNYSFYSFCWYHLYSKVFRSKLVFDYVERRSQMDVRQGNKAVKLNDYLFENFAFRMIDGAFVISDYLKDELLHFLDENRLYKLPPLCSYTKFESINTNEVCEQYFLYCGSVDYEEVVNFIIESYNLSSIESRIKLVLILSGSKDIVNSYISSFRYNYNVDVYTSLTQDELIKFYKNAYALLIPLRPRVQDIARFPQKVSEYAASKSVIISNGVGEMAEIFTHNINVLFADDYDVHSYSKLFKAVANGNYNLETISENSFKLGKERFDEKSHVASLNSFLKSLLGSDLP